MKNSDQKIVIYWSWQKTVSIICALLIIPVLLVFLFSMTLKTTIINREFYKKNLDKNNTYARLINDGIPSMILESKISDNGFSDTLSKSIIVYVVQKSIDPEWLKSITDGLIDQTANYFAASRGYGKDITLDLSSSTDFLNKVSSGLALAAQVIPDNANTEVIKNNIAQIQTQVNNISLGVIDIQNYVTTANSFIATIQNVIQNINLYFWISLILLIILISIIAILRFSDLKFALKTISLPMIVGSTGGLLFIWMLEPLTFSNLNLLNFNLTAEMNSIIIDLLKTNMLGVFHRYEWIAGVILLVFAIIYITTIILEKRKILK